MRRAGLGLLLLLCACGTPRRDTLDAVLASVREEVRHGDLSRALTLSDQGVALTSDRPSTVDAWRVRQARAEVLLLQRNPAAIDAFLREPLPDSPTFAGVRAKQRYLGGQLQVITGDLAGAVATLADAERLAQSAGDRDVLFGSRALRGQAEMRLQQWATAVSTLSTLGEEARRAGDDYHEALALINLGMGVLRRDRFDEALPYFERATALTKVALRIRAAALTNAGLCYTRLGDFDRALAMQQRAVQAHETSPKVFLEQALGELGTTYMLAGDTTRALTHLDRALRVALDAGLTEDAERWASNLAQVHISVGSWDDADRMNRQSGGLREKAGATDALVYNQLNEADIAAGRHEFDAAARLYTAVLAHRGTDPFIESGAHAGMARVARAAGRPPEAATHFESALRVIEHQQTGLLKADYKLTYLARLMGVYEEYIDMLVGQGQVERALEVADSSRARVLAERQGLANPVRTSARRFQRLAKATDSTLLVYWLGQRRSDAWAVTPDAIRHAALPAASEVASLVTTYQEALVTSLSNPLQSEKTAGDALYSLLLRPFAEALSKGASVVIVPDGALGLINFETLPVSSPNRHFWIEDARVSIAPSLGTLANAGPRRVSTSTRDTLLLIGDPVQADPSFPPLRFASAEMTAIAGAFARSSPFVIKAAQASPAAFRGAGPERFALIHFTAHATANADSPLDSAVVLSRDAGGYKLYARDVAGTPLDADLVTISACRSAGKRAYAGEGLVGFAWAFLRAGARRVLAGLWDVDDRSTAELMTQVYAGLARGEAPADALRAAKLGFIARGGAMSKPYYWGPFELIVATP